MRKLALEILPSVKEQAVQHCRSRSVEGRRPQSFHPNVGCPRGPLDILVGDIVLSTARADLQEGSELLAKKQTVQHYSLQIASGRCYDLVNALALLPRESSP